MKTMLNLGALLITIALTGCVTAQVAQAPSAPFVYTDFKSVSYDVHMTAQTEVADDAEDRQYAENATELFRSLLGVKLKELGYVVTPDATQADLRIDVPITEVKPGSGAARFWVGMGAGRAVFTFSANFTTRDGRRLGAFEGGRSYTGMELNQSAFPSHDELATRAAVRSVEQVEQYLRGGGGFSGAQRSAQAR
jgi:hypothetical protein